MFDINPKIYNSASVIGLFGFYTYAAYSASSSAENNFAWLFWSALVVHLICYLLTYKVKKKLLAFICDCIIGFFLMVIGFVAQGFAGFSINFNNYTKADIESFQKALPADYFSNDLAYIEKNNEFLGSTIDWANAALIAPDNNPIAFVLMATSTSVLFGWLIVGIFLFFNRQN